MQNPLLGVTIVLVVLGVLYPFLWLDGAGRYIEFLWENPNVVVSVVGSWGILVYFVVRRVAVVVLMRGAGAKLRVKQ